MSKEQPVAIVTGGAQGIGAAICTALLEEGYRICVADVQKEKGEILVSEKQKIFGKGRIIFSSCDVSKEENIHDTFRRTILAFKKVDVLVNNAGVIKEECPETVISINLLGAIYGCRMAFRFMGKINGGNGGFVINTASIAGLVPSIHHPIYSASKHGIIGLTRSFGRTFHFERDGIKFAAICPDLADTDIIKDTPRFKTLDSKDSLSSILLSPDCVAKGVLKVLEDQINGSTLLITKGNGYQYIELQEKLIEIYRFLRENKE